MLAPSPALFSTRTLWPRDVSMRTPAGVIPTRYSRTLISLGTPMITAGSSCGARAPDAGGARVTLGLSWRTIAAPRGLKRAARMTRHVECVTGCASAGDVLVSARRIRGRGGRAWAAAALVLGAGA